MTVPTSVTHPTDVDKPDAHIITTIPLELVAARSCKKRCAMQVVAYFQPCDAHLIPHGTLPAGRCPGLIPPPNYQAANLCDRLQGTLAQTVLLDRAQCE
jgi:hypothetical protein